MAQGGPPVGRPPVDKPWIVVSKREAALNQIRAAVEMYVRGCYDCAITLAGAAEDSLPDHPGSAREAFLTMDVPAEFAAIFAEVEERKGRRKGRNEWLNEARDWLKHDKPLRVLQIHRIDAEMMIIRAITKLDEPLWRLGQEHWWITWFLKQARAR
jgi:hypothetical protein